jgi:hypothetical protein
MDPCIINSEVPKEIREWIYVRGLRFSQIWGMYTRLNTLQNLRFSQTFRTGDMDPWIINTEVSHIWDILTLRFSLVWWIGNV